jgi:CRP-like cAMP-binding protein
MVVATSAGVIQFGAPPETIKDTIESKEGVAGIFVLTDFFDYGRGVSFAEIEFPVYHSFFMRKRPLRIVCTAEQRVRVERIIQESLFGPEHCDVSSEIADGRVPPDFGLEGMAFRAHPVLGERLMVREDLVEFTILDSSGSAVIDAVTIERRADGSFSIRDAAIGETATIPASLALPTRAVRREKRGVAFVPPPFGVTILGSGHGFDPHGSTTGFILWAAGFGILVDPPVDTIAIMREQGIPERSVEGVILTHCHADHDGGVLQKCLLADRMTLYTTPTIFRSFLRKAEAATGHPLEKFERILSFQPVRIGEPIRIHGAVFHFHYSFHSIPTIGFDVRFGGKTIAYSCDTFYDENVIRELVAAGRIGQARGEELLSFPWDSDLILHEAGIAPIHTPAEALAGLPDDVKGRLYVVHTTAKSLPPGSGLRIAPVGADRTLRLDAKLLAHQESIDLLHALRAVSYADELTLDRAIHLLEVASIARFPAGETIVRRGEPGDRYYLILSGWCDVFIGQEEVRQIGRYEAFGEASVLLGRPRLATVVAATDVTLVSIGRDDFLQFVRSTGAEERLRRLHENRSRGTWSLLDHHPILSTLSSAQREVLQSIMVRHRLVDGEKLEEADTADPGGWIVQEGEVESTRGGHRKERYGRGSFLADIEAVMASRPGGTDSGTAVGSVTAFRVAGRDLRDFLSHNPGIYLRLRHAGLDEATRGREPESGGTADSHFD